MSASACMPAPDHEKFTRRSWEPWAVSLQMQRLLQTQEGTKAEHQRQLMRLREEVSCAFDQFSKEQTTLAELVKALNILGVEVAMPEEVPEPNTPSLQQAEPSAEPETLPSEPECAIACSNAQIMSLMAMLLLKGHCLTGRSCQKHSVELQSSAFGDEECMALEMKSVWHYHWRMSLPNNIIAVVSLPESSERSTASQVAQTRSSKGRLQWPAGFGSNGTSLTCPLIAC